MALKFLLENSNICVSRIWVFLTQLANSVFFSNVGNFLHCDYYKTLEFFQVLWLISVFLTPVLTGTGGRTKVQVSHPDSCEGEELLSAAVLGKGRSSGSSLYLSRY